jgi:hypothetical protein
MMKTRKRITFFEYKVSKKSKNKEKKKVRICWKVWFEKIKIGWIREEITLCVLKKLNWQLSMIMLTNMKV